MINEKKVALMTKAAIYEKHEEYNGLYMSRFYQRDYVRFNVLKTWIAVTVAFWSVVGAYVFLQFQNLLEKINEMDYFSIMYDLIGRYVLVCAVYFVFAWFLYNVRYFKAKKGLVDYNSNLRQIIELEEGGGKVVSEKESRVSNRVEARVAPVPNAERGNVTKSDMIGKVKAEEEEKKRQEIIENMKRLNEQKAKRAEAEEKKRQQIEIEKQRIRENRRRLEAEQMERFKREQQEKFSREDHTYNGGANNDNMRGDK